ncbi:hypothetical protein KCU65_g9532, partial [Aureobasidium melanogenum]
MRLPRAKMADDKNAQATSQTEQNTEAKDCECKQNRTSAAITRAITNVEQLTKATDMMFDPSPTLTGSENSKESSRSSSTERPRLPTSPSQLHAPSPVFYLAPSITQAMQHMRPAMANLPYAPWPIVEPHDPNVDTFSSDDMLDKSLQTDQAVEPSPNIVYTSETHRQSPQNDLSYAENPSPMTQESSDASKKQAVMEQQKEKKDDTQGVTEDVIHAGFSVADFVYTKNLLSIKMFELRKQYNELEETRRSNTQLRISLSDMKDELAKMQAKLDQKNIYISACDKKIDALQKKIALLTRPYTGPTDCQLRIDSNTNANAESQLNKPASKPKKIIVPPTQSPAEFKAIDRSLKRSLMSMPRKTETKTVSERQARLKDAQLDYEAPLEEREVPVIRACEQSFRKQAELENCHVYRERSGKCRIMAEEHLWRNQEPSKETTELRQKNKELREDLDQAHAVDTSKSGSGLVRPKMYERILDRVARQETSDTATSHTEADQVRRAEGEGNGDAGERANGPLSQNSQCGSEWADVEKPDLYKEWPYAWW